MGTNEARARRKSRNPAEVRATADFTGAFGGFRFIERIERGGPAELWRAFWTGAPSGDERNCLVKRLRPELGDSPAFAAMFAEETRIMTALDHPNIVRVYTHGIVDGLPYLALEPLDGWSLQHLLGSLRRGSRKLPIEVAAFIGREVANALVHAHGAIDAQGNPLGIVHRDVRPANIMLLRSGAVKLVDFGVARVASFVSQTANAGITPGKPAYLSPEQLAGRSLDGRADLFSLGAVLWELLVGQPLFPPGPPEEVAKRLNEQPIAAPSSIRAGVPAALDELVLRLLARPLDRRASGAAEVARELGALVPAERDAARAISSMVKSGIDAGAAVLAAGAGMKKRSLARLLPPLRALLARGTPSLADEASTGGPRRPTAVVALDAVKGLRARLFRAQQASRPTSEITPQPPPLAPTTPPPIAPETRAPPPSRALTPGPWQGVDDASVATRAVAWLRAHGSVSETLRVRFAAWRRLGPGARARLMVMQALAVAAIAFAGGVLWHTPAQPPARATATSLATATRAATAELVVTPAAGVVIEPIAAPPPPAAEPASAAEKVKPAPPAKVKAKAKVKRRATRRR